MAEDNGYSEDELDEAYEQGRSDRQRYNDDLQGDFTGLETAIRQIVQDDYYNPPSDSELQEAYDRGFNE